MREENRRAVRHPARRRDVAIKRHPQRVLRLSLERLHSYGRDVLRIALQHRVDALVLLLLLLDRLRRRVGHELRVMFAITNHDGDRFPIGRDGRIAAVFLRLLPQCSLAQIGSRLTIDVDRALSQLRREAAVQPLRRITENAFERIIERTPLSRRHASPQFLQTTCAAALLEPFEICGAGEVRHRHAEE